MLGVGIDWAEEFHVVALGSPEEGITEILRVEHQPEAVTVLVERIARLEADPADVRVVIETRHGLLVEALVQAGYTVLPVNPDLVSRRRGPARKKDDAERQRLLSPAPLRVGKQLVLTICLSGDRAMLTPDGRSVIGGEYRQVRSRNVPPRFMAKLLEFSAHTGRLQRVLHVCGPGPTSMFFPGIESLAPSGLNALVYCVGTGFGRLEGSHFTLLPGLVSAW